MTYKTLSAEKAEQVAKLVCGTSEKGGAEDLDEAAYVMPADGPDVDLRTLLAVSAEAEKAWGALRQGRDPTGEVGRRMLDVVGRPAERERLEAFMAGEIHRALRDADPHVLGDIGFWRYLALFPLRWYLLAREREEGQPLKPQDFGGKQASPKSQLALRTYLWGKCAYDSTAPDPYERASKILREGITVSHIDVWHSHVLRVDIGHLGGTPHRFIDAICAKKLGTNGARELAKRLNRMKNVVMLDCYDKAGGEGLVASQCPDDAVSATRARTGRPRARSGAKAKKATRTGRSGKLRGRRR